MRKYTDGYVLKDNEYLLKIRPSDSGVPTGFLTKLNKNGTVPAAFQDWGKTYSDIVSHDGIPYGALKLPIYVVEEKFRSGWKLHAWRFGMSQNWASLIHPDNFTVEIYLQQFLNIAKTHVIDSGVIIGKFKWEDKKLIEQ